MRSNEQNFDRLERRSRKWLEFIPSSSLAASSIPAQSSNRTIMKYKLLGNSGLRVSEFALGTMTFGDDWGWGAPKDESQKVYNAFRESAAISLTLLTFIPTARASRSLASSSKDTARAWLKALYEASRVELGFPYDIYAKDGSCIDIWGDGRSDCRLRKRQ